jgi:hypothetical protein
MSENKNVRQLFIDLFWELVAFFILVSSIAFLWQSNLFLLTTVIIQCLVILWFWHERYDVTFFVVISVFGTIAEGAFVRSGIWHYNNPTFYGIPLWFPVAFGTTALISQRLALTLTDIWNKVA